VEAHEKILRENERWIIEGWVSEAMAERLRQADLVVYLDYPGWLAATHYVERWIKHREVARPELPKESRDHFKFRRFFLVFFRWERPQIENVLKLVDDPSKVVRITSMEQMEDFLGSAF
jgi:adenylate kinase family enzyme